MGFAAATADLLFSSFFLILSKSLPLSLFFLLSLSLSSFSERAGQRDGEVVRLPRDAGFNLHTPNTRLVCLDKHVHCDWLLLPSGGGLCFSLLLSPPVPIGPRVGQKTVSLADNYSNLSC